MAEKPFFDVEGRPFRFTVLFFAALLTFGSYFAYDIIGAVAPSLIEQFGADRSDVGKMYTMYSIAAILAVGIAGFLIDLLGTRLASMLFSTTVAVGALIVALSNSLWPMMVGRFIFGAGSEPLVVAQSAILARWFKGKELALAFGIGLTVSRLGTLFAFNTGELLAKYDLSQYMRGLSGPKLALAVAFLFCLLSLAGNIAYVILDRYGERALHLKDEEAGDKIVLSDIRQFGASYWYVTALCVTFYSAIFPFTALSTDFFVDKWGVPRTVPSKGGFLASVFNNFLHMFSTAGGLSSIIIFASMVFAPFAGHFVDKIGKRASLMVLGSLILIPAHLVMGLTHIYPALPMVFLGAAFVLVPAAMWPSVPLVVKKEHVGTAYGLMTMIQNIGLAVFPWLNGLLRDATKSYTASMLMFASLGLVGLIFAFLLLQADRRAGGVLERPGS